MNTCGCTDTKECDVAKNLLDYWCKRGEMFNRYGSGGNEYMMLKAEETYRRHRNPAFTMTPPQRGYGTR